MATQTITIRVTPEAAQVYNTAPTSICFFFIMCVSSIPDRIKRTYQNRNSVDEAAELAVVSGQASSESIPEIPFDFSMHKRYHEA